MAQTTMLTGDSNTVKRWCMETWFQTMQSTLLGDLMDNGAVHFCEEFMGRDTKGDQVTYDMVGRITGTPIGEGQTLVGNEKALDIGHFQMVVNETRDAVLVPVSGIEPQRTNINFENAIKKLIPQRCAELVETSMFQQLAGVTPTSVTADGTTYSTTAQMLHVQGHNTPTSPTTNRILRAAGAATDQALTSSDTFTLSLIDYALETNDVSLQPIKPLADGRFRLFISPYDYVNLKQDATSAIQWGNINLAKIQAGDTSNIEDRFGQNKTVIAGEYQNVLIIVSSRVAFGENSSSSAPISTVRRNVLVGDKALSFASPYGGRAKDTGAPIKIINQLQDYGKYKGVGFEMVYGIKKTVPTGTLQAEDWGTFVIGTYAAAHT